MPLMYLYSFVMKGSSKELKIIRNINNKFIIFTSQPITTYSVNQMSFKNGLTLYFTTDVYYYYNRTAYC